MKKFFLLGSLPTMAAALTCFFLVVNIGFLKSIHSDDFAKQELDSWVSLETKLGKNSEVFQRTEIREHIAEMREYEKERNSRYLYFYLPLMIAAHILLVVYVTYLKRKLSKFAQDLYTEAQNLSVISAELRQGNTTPEFLKETERKADATTASLVQQGDEVSALAGQSDRDANK